MLFNYTYDIQGQLNRLLEGSVNGMVHVDGDAGRLKAAISFPIN